MDLEGIQHLIDEAIGDGLLIESEGTVLSSAEGFNYAGRAVLGALCLVLGQPAFNQYCSNQRKFLGWLASKGNPISKKARPDRTRRRSGRSLSRQGG